MDYKELCGGETVYWLEALNEWAEWVNASNNVFLLNPVQFIAYIYIVKFNEGIDIRKEYNIILSISLWGTATKQYYLFGNGK